MVRCLGVVAHSISCVGMKSMSGAGCGLHVRWDQRRAFLANIHLPGRDDGVPWMSPAKLYADDSSSPAELELIIAACERYEADWNAGRSRSIENAVKTASAAIRPRLFRELLALELELARRAGQAVDEGEYVDRFPDSAAAVRDVFIGRHAARSRSGGDMASTVRGNVGSASRGLRTGSPRSERGARRQLIWRATAPCSAWSCSSVTTGSPRPAGARRCSTRAAPWRGSAARSSRRATGWRRRGDEIDLVVEYIPGRPLNRADGGRAGRHPAVCAAGRAGRRRGWPRSTPAACCTATSSRKTSSWATTACRGWSTSAWRSRSRARPFTRSAALPLTWPPSRPAARASGSTPGPTSTGWGACLYYLLTGQATP